MSEKVLMLPSLNNLKSKAVSLHQSVQENFEKPKKHLVSLHEKPFNKELNKTQTSNTTNNDIKEKSISKIMLSKLKPIRNSIFYDRRTRNYEVKLSNRIHIFYGLLYVQYEGYLRYDLQLQKIVIRDLLNMLLDKASSLKNMLNDVTRMKKIFSSLKKHRQAELNIKLETITGLLNFISQIILLDFKNCYEEIGLKHSPIEKNEQLFHPIRNEFKAFEINTKIFNEIVEFYRDCMDCFFILIRQNKKRLFDESTATNLIKAISESRFSIGKLYEEYIMHENIFSENENNQIEEILQLIKKKKQEERDKKLGPKETQKIVVDEEKEKNMKNQETVQMNNSDKRSSIEKNLQNPIQNVTQLPNTNNLTPKVLAQSQKELNESFGDAVNTDSNLQSKKRVSTLIDKSLNKKTKVTKEYFNEIEDRMQEKILRMEKLKVLNTLMQNKFKFKASKFNTRESKIPLNTKKENLEKEVLLNRDSIKSEKIIADNRKRIVLARINNPFSFLGTKENWSLMKKLEQMCG